METQRHTATQAGYGPHVVAFLVGAAIGATVATIYAPASGADTRAQIAHKGNQAKDKAGQYLDDAVGFATGIKDKAVSVAHNTLDTVARAL